MAIVQQNGDYDLSGVATVYSQTAAADGVWDFKIKIGDGSKDLDSAAGTLSYVVTVAGQVQGGNTQNRPKGAGAIYDRVGERTGPHHVESGDTVVITLESDNAADTDVDVTVTPRQVLEVDNVADALLDQDDGIETDMTVRQAMRVMAAVMAGKVSGAGSGLETFKGLDGSTTRVQVTTDAAGNRTNVSYTPD